MKKSNLIRTTILAGILLLQLSTLCFHSRGAAGDVDLSFDAGSGVNGYVSAAALQPDGKIIIGGGFSMVKGLVRPGIARLNADSTLDTTFDPGSGVIGPFAGVFFIAVQSDGKLLIGGRFAGFHETYRPNLVRLHANGSVDHTFVPGLNENGSVNALALQADGKVLMAGGFESVNGVTRPYVARLYGDSFVLSPSLNIT